MFWLKLDWIDGSDSYILSQIGTLSSIQKKTFFFANHLKMIESASCVTGPKPSLGIRPVTPPTST